ncbi:phloem protein 2-B15 [Hibiscus trionum]|uniref:Phloem protein 2-B15 n=1 Tax=Hibiscus trionum TaxID=183268 RepID=A0A9W7GUP8_HIBTR|nr:phloem protein 2-B15 [Hibiscus trionum]
MEAFELNMLPESCISVVLSLTSPSDACKSSLVSTTFRSAADSDSVWGKFLPSDYREIVSESCDKSLQFCSKKELYLLLCNPVVVADGRMSFKLERSSGKISYILSARELSITGSNDPTFWVWKSDPESRFSEVAELVTTSWLEIKGKIRTKKLSPNTKYGAYLLLKIAERSYGLDLIPSETSIEIGNQISKNTAYLRCQDTKKQQLETLFYSNRKQMMKSRVIEGDDRVTTKRDDGWMEIELGEFFNGGIGDEEVKMSLMEIKGHQLKGGVIIEGIEIRPKTYNSRD